MWEGVISFRKEKHHLAFENNSPVLTCAVLITSALSFSSQPSRAGRYYYYPLLADETTVRSRVSCKVLEWGAKAGCWLSAPSTCYCLARKPHMEREQPGVCSKSWLLVYDIISVYKVIPTGHIARPGFHKVQFPKLSEIDFGPWQPQTVAGSSCSVFAFLRVQRGSVSFEGLPPLWQLLEWLPRSPRELS